MCERVIVVLFNLCLGFDMMKGPLRDHCYVFTDVYHLSRNDLYSVTGPGLSFSFSLGGQWVIAGYIFSL